MIEYILSNYLQKLGKLDHLLEEDFLEITRLAHKFQKQGKPRLLIARLIHQLQYHDIIRQKIEHVAKFCRQLEDELHLYVHDQQKESVISGLIELSMALLQYAHLEYEEAREDIKEALAEAGTEELIPGDNFNEFQQKVQEYIEILAGLHQRLNLPPIDPCNTQLLEEFKQLTKVFSMHSEREIFRSLFEGQLVFQDPPVEPTQEDNDTIELF